MIRTENPYQIGDIVDSIWMERKINHQKMNHMMMNYKNPKIWTLNKLTTPMDTIIIIMAIGINTIIITIDHITNDGRYRINNMHEMDSENFQMKM